MKSTIHRSFKKRTAHRHLELTDEQYTKIFGQSNVCMLNWEGWRLKAFQLLEFIPLEEHQQIYSELLQGHIQYVKVHRPLNNRPLWGSWSKDKYSNVIEDLEEARQKLVADAHRQEVYQREYLGEWESDK